MASVINRLHPLRRLGTAWVGRTGSVLLVGFYYSMIANLVASG
jgi:hypothetical protein